MRTTLADVKRAFTRLQNAHRSAGVTLTVDHAEYSDERGPDGRPIVVRTPVTFTADDLVLSEGSQTYGRAYRLHYRHPVSGAHYNVGVSDFLGMTRREAELSLSAMAEGIYLVTQDR